VAGNNAYYFCSLNFVNFGMPRLFYDLECNFRLWIVTQICYMSLSFEIIMMPLWPESNWRMTDIICPIKFCKCWDTSVILSSWVQFWTMNCHSYMIYELEFWNYYDASMTRKELTGIICPIKIFKCWMPRWFYDLECNSRLWIVTHI